jgi:hypothetical protein
MFSLDEGLVALLDEVTKKKFLAFANFKFKIDSKIIYTFLMSISKSPGQ